jgi:hypothetical protein
MGMASNAYAVPRPVGPGTDDGNGTLRRKGRRFQVPLFFWQSHSQSTQGS